ncbi:cytosine deaminase [Pseudochelatococcus lubricantis]|uniref:Cytosine deaminase n=1 Tax=Pseudochelatococcus lubricantis TaxID=1538102 RepID=A0ABX0V7M4_9HYPH|nr:cytosine deaminase [Pseudochelatococcus lubricantis]NIJ59106.1 cytosine deaminase [Pseudochelatococcus lubricantis]
MIADIRTMADIRDAIRRGAAAGGYVLTNARIPAAVLAADLPGQETAATGFVTADLHIAGGGIRGIVPRDMSAREPWAPDVARPAPCAVIDLRGRIVLPPFVDCHAHLDKGHILPRTADGDGTLPTAIAVTAADRTHWTPADLRRRMGFALRCAHHHGTASMRTHIDSQPGQYRVSWEVFEELRDTWRGRIALQGASLFSIEYVRDETFFTEVCRRVGRAGGALGAVVFPTPDVDDLLERMFRAASDHGLPLDFHADETSDPSSNMLERIADRALARAESPPVLVGHCCSLAVQDENDRRRTLEKVARAGLGIVSLPLCNLHLQDRRHDATTPRWRGITAIHEMHEQGIPVAIASDNTRDPFHPFGDLDMMEVFRIGVRVMHLDRAPGSWIDTVNTLPAKLIGIAGGPLCTGAGADLVICEGRSWSELLSRPQAARIVVAGASPLDSPLPDYAELDESPNEMV